jgi:hypothetical protein
MANKTPKVKDLPKTAGKKASDVKGGMLPSGDKGTQDKTYCCRTACSHKHCTD